MKPQVNYAILEDMARYFREEELSEYESTCGETSPDALAQIREHYDNHPPVDITAWVRVNVPDESLIYAKQFANQVVFVRDILGRLLWYDVIERVSNQPNVISTHVSKSVKLPVYQIIHKKFGLEIVLSNNFYYWVVSIKSEKPISLDFMGLFDETDEVPYYFCYGFPRDKVYGSYVSNNSKFTFEIRDEYQLYVVIFLIKNFLDIK
jgi:hypothetical protein